MNIRHRLLSLLVITGLASCGTGDKAAQSSKKSDSEIKPTVTVPPPPEFYEGTPYWEVQSRQWPPVLEWTLGDDGEHTFDSLNLRVTGEALQNHIPGPKSTEHPLMCWFELTVRPIPKRLIGYSFTVDSVVFFDPIKQRQFPGLPMLSVERYTQKGVVRTRFGNNVARPLSPDLQENQQLVPTLFITSIDKKTIIVTMEPLTVPFVREVKTEPIPTDSMKWGPS